MLTERDPRARGGGGFRLALGFLGPTDRAEIVYHITTFRPRARARHCAPEQAQIARTENRDTLRVSDTAPRRATAHDRLTHARDTRRDQLITN